MNPQASWEQVQLQDDPRDQHIKAIVRRAAKNQHPIEGVIEGVDGAIIGGLITLQQMIALQLGLRAPALAQALKTSPKNVERWLSQLKQAGTIHYRVPRCTQNG